jgi:serine phosphatase RsbU (regulator of sigma subunit)/anti-sigma regulatory factor (Ser/Thr protein kinase)
MNKTLEFLIKPFRRRPAASLSEAQQSDGQPADLIHETQAVSPPDFELEPDDPLKDYFRANPSVALLEKIQIESPALERLKAAGIKLVVPLVSQGELIGMLNLGPRLSEQDYSSDDIALLNNLAAQATPAVRVAQLVREQQEEAKERERVEQEMRVARLIQQTLLPKELPDPEGWSVQAFYQPARAVGGDFYDFIELPGDHLGIFVGDVTDKGVPAALVMATTRRVLRFAAMAKPVTNSSGEVDSFAPPGQVLEQANNLLCPDIPANMFVTCMYAVLDLASGTFRFANAGHNPPYRYDNGQTDELRATGMPLGLMPGMSYEERQAVLKPGECVLFYSDGLTEAHNPQREMFGFERVMEVMSASADREDFIRYLLDQFEAFTGAGWDQEDDVTVVVLNRQAEANPGDFKRLAAFEVESEPGNERQAIRRVTDAVQSLDLDKPSLERVKTAVAEATMNAIEHGNHFQPDLPVKIEVWSSGKQLKITIRDYGGGRPIPEPGLPNLDAKLAGEQSPRGWGLFLIENMVDEMHVSSDGDHHTLAMMIDLKGKQP